MGEGKGAVDDDEVGVVGGGVEVRHASVAA